MKRFLKIILQIKILSFLTNFAAGNKYNVSYDLLKQCQEYDTFQGYGYRDYFKIKEMEHADIEDFAFNLRIILLATKDAHILLSPVKNANSSDDVYEIVLGAGENTFCEIRKNKQKNPIKTKLVKDVLSPIDPLPLVIKVNSTQEDGSSIEVWIENETMPLISVIDSNPIETHYISFTSWGSSKAKFFYDCPREKDKDSEDDDAFLEGLESTGYDRLEHHIFAEYDVFKYLSFIQNITIESIKFSRIRYIDKDNRFDITVQLNLEYYDNRLIWDPSDYENITHIDDYINYVFTPKIMVPRGQHNSFLPISLYYDIKIFHTGRIFARAREHEISVWCDPMLDPQSKSIDCDLTLSVDQENLPLLYDEKLGKTQLNDLNKQHYCKVEKIRVTKIKHVNIIQIQDAGESDKMDINFQFIFRHDIEARLRVFYATLLGGFILMGLSTFVKGFLKFGLIVIAILVFVCSLVISHILAPVLYKANITYYYQIGLHLSLVLLSTSTFEAWFSYIKPMSVINIPYLKLILGFMKYNTSSYDGLNQYDSMWMEILDAVNRLCLVITFLIAAILLGVGY